MTAVTLTPHDLAPFAEIDVAKALAMIDDALALAAQIAPCITDEAFEHPDAAKAVIRGAILRWNEAGSGALTQQGAGPFQVSIDSRQQRRGMFWPTEIEQLQKLCQESGTGGAFAVDTVSTTVVHADVCAVNFGAVYCSCGAILTGSYPLYEV